MTLILDIVVLATYSVRAKLWLHGAPPRHAMGKLGKAQ